MTSTKTKVGRPRTGLKKPHQRMISTADDVEDYLEEKGINATRLFDGAVRAIMPNDPEEVELEKLEDDIAGMETVIATKKARRTQLQIVITNRKRLAKDLRLEAECGAWFLHTHIEEGKLSLRTPPAMPSAEIIELCSMLKQKGYPITITNGEAVINGTETRQVREALTRVRLCVKDGKVVNDPDALKPTVYPPDLSIFSLSVEKQFLTDFQSGIISESTPVAELMRYHPTITNENVKREVKERMAVAYGFWDVPLKDAKESIEKPWGGR